MDSEKIDSRSSMLRRKGFLNHSYLLRSKLLACVLLALSLVQCTEEKNFVELVENYTVSGSPILTYSSEMESTTHFTPDEEITSNLDLAVMTPMVNKQKITMEVYTDGNLKITTENMDASQNIEIPHTVLPNPDPVPHKSVMFGNELLIYDESGELILSSEEVPIIKVPELVELIQEIGNENDEAFINEVISNMQSHLFLDRLEDFIANPQEHGATVQELNEGLVSITMPMSLAEPGNTDETVLLLDRNRNLLLASRIYDQDDNWKSSTMYKYKEGESPILEGMKQDMKDVLPSGIEATIETYTSISNVQVEVHL